MLTGLRTTLLPILILADVNMKNKKAQLTIVIIVIVILAIIASIIVALSYMNKKIGETKSENSSINLFIKAIDSNGLIKVNYTLVSNESIISGELSDWINLVVDSKSQYTLYCWNNENYLINISKTISNEEKTLNSTKIICNPDKIGNLTIKTKGSIESKFIELEISTNDTFKDISICESHTIGITKVNLIGLYCSYWNNVSHYEERFYRNKTPYYVPIYYADGLRFCNEWSLNCKKFENSRCYIDEMEVPNRLKTKVDHCWDIKKTLNNSNLNIQFQLETFNTNDKDKVIFYIIDKESRYNGNLTKFIEINIDNNYVDIGAIDKIVEIR